MKKWIFAALALCVANPAAAGAPEALPEKTFELGMKYANAAQPDWNKALEMFRLAADWGDARAQHALGRMYHQGTGVARDDAMAFKYCLAAAKNGL
ncbi:MAG: SEL1-like repeat protein, partial [Pyramidobacter sp.]|nr:SEL1-like repeat protein [Pyramidobacter sp.]